MNNRHQGSERHFNTKFTTDQWLLFNCASSVMLVLLCLAQFSFSSPFWWITLTCFVNLIGWKNESFVKSVIWSRMTMNALLNGSLNAILIVIWIEIWWEVLLFVYHHHLERIWIGHHFHRHHHPEGKRINTMSRIYLWRFFFFTSQWTHRFFNGHWRGLFYSFLKISQGRWLGSDSVILVFNKLHQV